MQSEMFSQFAFERKRGCPARSSLDCPVVGAIRLIAFRLSRNYHQTLFDFETSQLNRGLKKPREMTPDGFRRLALKMEGAIEGAHMGHPDFRANGKIFATLYPDGQRGMVQLKPEQQQDFISTDNAAFAPASGAWGRGGSTTVQLALVDEDQLGEAMTLAWQNTVKAAAQAKPKRASKPAMQSRQSRK